MRRARRTRMSNNRNQVVERLVALAYSDEKLITRLQASDYGYCFGKLLNKWLDSSRESVIDRYIDTEAKDATWYAINIIKKEVNN